MIKILLGFICFLASIFSIQAQTLYSTTLNGGDDGGGVINKFIPFTNDLTVVKSFETLSATPSFANFTQASDGKLYAMTPNGGANNVGFIFSYDPSASVELKVKNFDNNNGAHPNGSLIQASDGKLYGLTHDGGTNNAGVIFSFDLSTSTYTKLYDFDSANGAHPYGSLLEAADGKLYGMTYAGGSSNAGVIFSFKPSSSTYIKLKDFDITNGAKPYGNLIQATDGKLYGITNRGGSTDDGVIFSYNPSISTYTKLKDFDSSTGSQPYGSLVQATDGKLYGMTNQGGSGNYGVIFSFDTSPATYTKQMDFHNSGHPKGSLIQATDGKLYGFAFYGSSPSLIFSFNPSTSIYTQLYEFGAFGDSGAKTPGSLMQATDGKLYGMGSYAFMAERDFIFSYDPSTSSYATLKDFGPNESGRNVIGCLLHANDGKLYGLTRDGGTNNFGVIFSYDLSSATYKKLTDFPSGRLGGSNTPFGGLIQASNGKLYGMTHSGGVTFDGAIFSFDPFSSSYTKLQDLYKFGGSSPFGSLLQAADEKLYGMTYSGGSNDAGAIFSFDPSSSTYTKLKDLDNINGAPPYGSLIQASHEKLYGMTYNGGNNDAGVIFSFDPSSSTYIKLMDFDRINGANPYGSLIQARDGNMYGMTSSGGMNNFGVIFSFDPASFTYTKLIDFDSTDGAHPYGNLMQAGNGMLYGMTYDGGSSNKGVIFSFDPKSLIYTKLKDYDGGNGANPFYGSAFIETPESGPLPVTLVSFAGKNTGISNDLQWKVALERNISYYELQRSIDGQNFEAISQIAAKGNNYYSYKDNLEDAVSSVYYYRLKSVDVDGGFKYSTIIKIITNVSRILAVVNPNPFKNTLVIHVESVVQGKASFILTDLSGRRLFKEDKLLFPGNNIVKISELSRLSRGIYLLTIIRSQQTQNIKVIKGN